jgi:hypothetical protein
MLLCLNIAALVLFAHALTEARWYDIFQNAPLNILAIFILVGFHWHLLGRIQKSRSSPNYEDRDGRGDRLPVTGWLIYLVISVLLLFASVLLATLN